MSGVVIFLCVVSADCISSSAHASHISPVFLSGWILNLFLLPCVSQRSADGHQTSGLCSLICGTSITLWCSFLWVTLGVVCLNFTRTVILCVPDAVAVDSTNGEWEVFKKLCLSQVMYRAVSCHDSLNNMV